MNERPLYQPLFLRDWRKHKGLSQERVVDALPIDLSVASLRRLENGKQPYTQQTVEALAQRFNCAPYDLFHKPTESELWHKINSLDNDDVSSALILMEVLFGRRKR